MSMISESRWKLTWGQINCFPVGSTVVSRCGFKRGVVVGADIKEGVIVRWEGYSYDCGCHPDNLKSWTGEEIK